ncbi:thrombospondin-type laminin G domain and EAR repeat-containing protein-like [Ptychodera flava]|uniref:thrombospondin-type laminin G domain and EAR repeat-containing protein-like n=1 Tax=Ptychodera flava TaxID=63121 RepID=UPI00396AB083
MVGFTFLQILLLFCTRQVNGSAISSLLHESRNPCLVSRECLKENQCAYTYILSSQNTDCGQPETVVDIVTDLRDRIEKQEQAIEALKYTIGNQKQVTDAVEVMVTDQGNKIKRIGQQNRRNRHMMQQMEDSLRSIPHLRAEIREVKEKLWSPQNNEQKEITQPKDGACSYSAVNTIRPGCFRYFQNISTYIGSRMKTFLINNTMYLAVPNFQHTVIYRWYMGQFLHFQDLHITQVRGVEYFSIEGQHYLALAKFREDKDYHTNSPIFKWDGQKFTQYQIIPTTGAFDWLYFRVHATTGSQYFLLMVNSGTSHGSGKIENIISKWNGHHFLPIQSILTGKTKHASSFTIDDQTFISFAIYEESNSNRVNSQIYKIQTDSPSPSIQYYETLPIAGGSYAVVPFKHEGQTYLMDVIRQKDDSSFTAESPIYLWKEDKFEVFQTIPTTGARMACPFEIMGRLFLAVANWRDETTYRVDSVIYKFVDDQFVEYQRLPTTSASDCEVFYSGNSVYLMFSNASDNPESASMIFKMDGATEP